jgi:hypothetical protein
MKDTTNIFSQSREIRNCEENQKLVPCNMHPSDYYSLYTKRKKEILAVQEVMGS